MRAYTLLFTLLLLSACGAATEEAADPGPLPTSQPQNMLRLANATRAAGDLRASEQIYKDMIRNDPNAIEPYLGLVNLYESGGFHDQAASTLQSAIGIKPDDFNLRVALAQVLVSGNQPNAALEQAEKATSLEPTNARGYNIKGVALDAVGRFKEAQESYRQAINLEPRSNYILNNLALSYIMSDKYDAAIKTLKPLVESEAATPTLRQNLALAYGLKGETDKAYAIGVKDLPEEKVRENIEFYKDFIAKRESESGKKSDTAVTPVSSNALPDEVPASVAIEDTSPILIPGKDQAAMSASLPPKKSETKKTAEAKPAKKAAVVVAKKQESPKALGTLEPAAGGALYDDEPLRKPE